MSLKDELKKKKNRYNKGNGKKDYVTVEDTANIVDGKVPKSFRHHRDHSKISTVDPHRSMKIELNKEMRKKAFYKRNK